MSLIPDQCTATLASTAVSATTIATTTDRLPCRPPPPPVHPQTPPPPLPPVPAAAAQVRALKPCAYSYTDSYPPTPMLTPAGPGARPTDISPRV